MNAMHAPDLSRFLSEGTPDQFQQLTEAYGIETILTGLMELYPSLPEQAKLARLIASSGVLQRSGQPIRTIAVFYYRVCHGGAERVCCHLIRLWLQAGYRVILLTDFPPDPADEYLPPDVTRYQLPDTFRLDPNTRKQRFQTIQRILRNEKADAFVHHAWLSRNLLWDLLAVKSLGIPYIQYTHGVFSCLISEGHPEEMDELRWLTDIYALPDAVICLSETFRTFWQHYTPRPLRFLNPCSPARGAPCPSSDRPIILWSGRIAPEKQPLEALKIFSLVRQTVPEARLVMLGGADAAYAELESELTRQISGLGLTEAVILPGFVADPSPFYQHASVLLSTSLNEGFSLVIAEAKTYGLPCVMYDLPYLYFAEESRGLCRVPQGGAAAAADTIIRLLRHPDEWEAMRQEALASADAFSETALTEQWTALFRSLSSVPDPVSPAESRDTVVLSTLLDHLHMGLDRVGSDLSSLQQKAQSGGSFSLIFNPRFYAEKYPWVRRRCKGHDYKLLAHFLRTGMKKGLQGNASFSPQVYRSRYPDLEQAFGNHTEYYYYHYLLYGYIEGRTGI